MGLAHQTRAQMDDPETFGRIPPLYGGTIRYKREPIRRENWQAAHETATLGFGDCEDLSAYFVAQCWANNIEARPKVKRINETLRHVIAVYRDPRTGQWVEEDPSAKLGMYGDG